MLRDLPECRERLSGYADFLRHVAQRLVDSDDVFDEAGDCADGCEANEDAHQTPQLRTRGTDTRAQPRLLSLVLTPFAALVRLCKQVLASCAPDSMMRI